MRAALDALEQAVALYDPAGRQVFANAALQGFAARADGLVPGPAGQVVPAEPRARIVLARALTAATAGIHVAVLVPRASGAAPYVLRCRPVRGAPGWAMTVVADPQRRPAADAALLRRAFGLTAAEAELAAALGHGSSVAEHAAARGISVHTARCQLRAVLSKVGARRQAEVVAIVTALAA